MRKNIFLLSLIIGIEVTCFSQVTQKINSSNNTLVTSKLKESKSSFLVYVELKNGLMMDISIWRRNVSIIDNQIKIEQFWQNQDKSRNREIISINDRKTFASIYQKSKTGKGDISAFNFYRDRIIGTDSVKSNAKKDFKLELTDDMSGVLNWELDLEILELLDYELGKTFSINFYHPGSKSIPKYYDYKVIGEEKISTSLGQNRDCWILKIVYNDINNATFWIDKKTNSVLKMEEVFMGGKRIKIRILPV